MKKTLLALSVTLSSLYVSAQISLTNANHAPLVGDSCLITVYDTTNLLPVNTGANQTWNFSNINLDSTGNYMLRFVTPSSGAPSGTTVSEDRPSGFSRHYKNSSTKLEILGFNDPSFSVSFSGDALYRNWPMTFNNTISDTANGTYTTGPNPLIPTSGPITVNTKSVVSGYGNLIAPNGATYSNVLQVLDTVTFAINASNPPYTTGVGVTLCSMNYYSSSIKHPVISFSAQYTVNYAFNNSSGQMELFTVDTTTVFEFNRTPPSSPSGVFLSANNNELKIYPNPVSYLLNLETTDSLYVEIYSLDGRLIESHSVQGILSINVADYTSGIYLVRTLDSNGNISQQKFVKQ
jgi:hypothetical protein